MKLRVIFSPLQHQKWDKSRKVYFNDIDGGKRRFRLRRLFATYVLCTILIRLIASQLRIRWRKRTSRKMIRRRKRKGSCTGWRDPNSGLIYDGNWLQTTQWYWSRPLSGHHARDFEIFRQWFIWRRTTHSGKEEEDCWIATGVKRRFVRCRQVAGKISNEFVM